MGKQQQKTFVCQNSPSFFFSFFHLLICRKPFAFFFKSKWLFLSAAATILRGGIVILVIKKSRAKDEYIVYNPHHFQLHTHTRHKRIAVIIKSNVEHHRVPRSTDLRLLESHIRLTSNKSYLRKLEARREELLAAKAAQKETGGAA